LISTKEIAEKTMTDEKKISAKQNIFAFYIGRPISYVFTIPFLYTHISPNKITIISIIFSLLGFVFTICPTSKWYILIGWLFFFLWNIFDGVDGNVARFKMQFSKNGSLFDATAGYLQVYLSYLAYGVAAYFHVGIITETVNLPLASLIVFGSLSSFFAIFPRLIMHKKISMQNDKNTDDLQKKESFNFFKVVALNISSPSGFIQVIMLAMAILSIFDIFVFDIFTIFYFAFNFLFMLVTVYKLLSN